MIYRQVIEPSVNWIRGSPIDGAVVADRRRSNLPPGDEERWTNYRRKVEAAALETGTITERRDWGLSERGDWCCQIAFAPRWLPAIEVAFAASTRCEGEKRDACVPCDYSRGANGYEP